MGSNDYGVHKPFTLAYTNVIVHGGKVMAIVAQCESAQQFRALMIIYTEFYDAPNALSHVFLRHPRSCLLCFFDNPYISPFNSQICFGYI